MSEPTKAPMLSSGHWAIEDFRQRMIMADWRKILLNEMDSLVFRGNVRRLVAKNLGAGVVEVSKKPTGEKK